MNQLSQKECVPCKAGADPLTHESIKPMLFQIQGWAIFGNHHIHRDFKFKDFKSALDFVNIIGQIAEREGHHPDIELIWGRVGVTFYTHKINGLHENDFIMAAKIDEA